MKIRVRGEELTAKSVIGRNLCFRASEVRQAHLKSDFGTLPRAPREPLCVPATRLRFLLISTLERKVMFDALWDRGFDLALEWLEGHGWDVDAAIRESKQKPFASIAISPPD